MKSEKRAKDHARSKCKRSGRSKKKHRHKHKQSSTSSETSSMDIQFVLDRDYGSSSHHRLNQESKIQRALGFSCGSFEFVKRDDDLSTERDVGQQKRRAEDGRLAEDTSRDWICQRSKANGEMCGGRNFVKNEKCFVCGSLRPTCGPQLLRAGDVKPARIDGVCFR